MQRVLITGGAGFIGSHLCERFLADGADGLEIWNEMNIDREWKQGAINPAIYVNLLAKSYNAIKANNGNTLVISGALAAFSLPSGIYLCRLEAGGTARSRKLMVVR